MSEKRAKKMAWKKNEKAKIAKMKMAKHRNERRRRNNGEKKEAMAKAYD